jgi:hypothetical protein
VAAMMGTGRKLLKGYLQLSNQQQEEMLTLLKIAKICADCPRFGVVCSIIESKILENSKN